MQAAIVALIISALDVIEIWTEWSPGVDAKWIETFLMALNPILVWAVPWAISPWTSRTFP
jgi:hypothetical protein